MDSRKSRLKFVNEYIRHFVAPHHDDWDTLLPLCEFAYNSRVHSTTGMSLFMADLGYQPRSVSDCVVATSRQSSASKFITHQKAILAEAQDAMATAQERWHAAYDRNRSHLVFAVGDKVLLNTKNLALAHLGTDGKRKFAPRFIGPYLITDITGPDTYKLALPPGLRLHPEYHVSRLRPYHHDDHPARITRLQPVITTDGTEGHLVHSIVGHRRRKGVRQFKVKWLDTSLGSSWEPPEAVDGQIEEVVNRNVTVFVVELALERHRLTSTSISTSARSGQRDLFVSVKQTIEKQEVIVVLLVERRRRHAVDEVRNELSACNSLNVYALALRFGYVVPGVCISTVFVFDTQPRNSCDIATLEKLSNVAMKNLEDRKNAVAAPLDNGAAVEVVENDEQQAEAPKRPAEPLRGSGIGIANQVVAQPVPGASQDLVAANAGDGQVTAGPKMETMLMDLLCRTTETQQQLATQQGAMFHTLGQHTADIDKLATAMARMEAKLDAMAEVQSSELPAKVSPINAHFKRSLEKEKKSPGPSHTTPHGNLDEEPPQAAPHRQGWRMPSDDPRSSRSVGQGHLQAEAGTGPDDHLRHPTHAPRHHAESLRRRQATQATGGDLDGAGEAPLDLDPARRCKECVSLTRIIKMKAQDIQNELCDAWELTFSDGWLTAFERRHGLRYRQRHGEAAYADADAVRLGRHELQEITDLYSPKDIYNMDEMGLCYAMAPARSICTRGTRGVKKRKHGLLSRSLLMQTVQMFCQISFGVHILLRLDNASSHNTGDISMDAGIIALFKRAYQRKQLRWVYDKIKHAETIEKNVYAVDQLQAMQWSEEVWKGLQAKDTIATALHTLA
ncbi:hypothetical protein ON010_g11221 [Phytophthora cinnamomi]|nr:hypothetical protein ON010_g11221 [Phytophthora cinnamomi]